jgi:tetratricopeptide (TPR) repeat protein
MMKLAIAILTLCFAAPSPCGAGGTNGPADFAARARSRYLDARARFEWETNSPAAALDYARACFDWADLAPHHAERADVAQRGIAVAEALIARDPGSAPAHYYLAMNIGQLARTKSLGALRLLGRMEKEYETARTLDEHLDHAGADRGLGLLYLEAPSVGSIGNRTKARAHLEKAVQLDPDDPENQLNLIEACLKWGDKSDAESQMQALDKLWPRARSAFAGDDWALSWQDWQARRAAAREKLRKARAEP